MAAAALIPIIASLITGGSVIGSQFLNKGGKETEVFDPHEKKKAREMLLEFVNSGRLGDFKAGEAYEGKLGNFDVTETEKKGQGLLSNLLDSANPELFSLGSDELKKLLTTDAYNPFSETGVYAPYKTQVLREAREGSDRVKANAAFSGNLYSTNTIKDLGNVEVRAQEGLQSKLADLYDTFTQRKLGAIPLAFQAGAQEENTKRARISDAFQFGGLERNLKDLEAQRQYQDYLRRRSELQLPLQSLNTLIGGNSQIGVSQESNPWSQVLNALTFLGSRYLGNNSGSNTSDTTKTTPYNYGKIVDVEAAA